MDKLGEAVSFCLCLLLFKSNSQDIRRFRKIMYWAVGVFLFPSGSFRTVPASFCLPLSSTSLPFPRGVSCPRVQSIKLCRESLCLKWDCTLSALLQCRVCVCARAFVSRNRTWWVGWLISKPFSKRYFLAQNPFVLSDSVGGLDSEGWLKMLHEVGDGVPLGGSVSDFPLRWRHGWLWPRPCCGQGICSVLCAGLMPESTLEDRLLLLRKCLKAPALQSSVTCWTSHSFLCLLFKQISVIRCSIVSGVLWGWL